MLIDDEEEEEKKVVVPAALPAVEKEKDEPTAVTAGADGAKVVAVPSRPGSGGQSLSEEDIETLIGMGFTKSQAEGALRMNSYSVERAADYLLNN
jgi:hypothetical protein